MRRCFLLWLFNLGVHYIYVNNIVSGVGSDVSIAGCCRVGGVPRISGLYFVDDFAFDGLSGFCSPGAGIGFRLSIGIVIFALDARGSSRNGLLLLVRFGRIVGLLGSCVLCSIGVSFRLGFGVFASLDARSFSRQLRAALRF